jgi:hypothetical protein
MKRVRGGLAVLSALCGFVYIPACGGRADVTPGEPDGATTGDDGAVAQTDSPEGIALNSTTVFWVDFGDGTIKSVPK